tara:strand:- start:2348 stop:4618 length:2271 start_codon:yes stop_codon:yes gene_type:complete
MSKARGKLTAFEPANVAGLDTRIWQGKGSAGAIDGVEFSLEGEIIKAFGYQRLLSWRREQGARGLVEVNPLKDAEVLTLGTFTWGGATELVVAYWVPPYVADLTDADRGKVFIAVLETNKLRTIYSYALGRTKPRPNKYPRFTDAGQFLIITVDGMKPRKWDGRLLTMMGIHTVPEPVQVAAMVGLGDKKDEPTSKPDSAGDFWESHCFDQDDATAAEVEYYQTFMNMYGQESNLSAVSNRLVLSDYLEVSAKKSFAPAVGGNASVGFTSTVAGMAGVGQSSSSAANYSVTTEGSYNSTSPSTASGTPLTNVTRISGANAGSPQNRRIVAFLDLGDPPPEVDITHRLLYRSISGQPPVALPRKLGVASNTHFDVRRIVAASATPAPGPGENDPPPPARWCFMFRGRAYYRGEGSILYYSKLNFPEAVSTTNFIEINTSDGDEITAWGASQDYAIIFKRKSAFLLTHDKSEEPVITPLQGTFGAITDRAVITYDNNTYFLSDIGFHLFDGSSFKRLSSVLDQKVKQLPMHTRESATVFADRSNNRVYISVNGNPGVENNQVWAIHTDNGAFTVIDNRPVAAAVPYKGEVILSAKDSGDEYNLFLWGTGYDLDGEAFTGSYSTEWIELKNPHSDKRFYKLLMYFVQTGNISMTVSWYADWDDRTPAGSATFTLKADDALYWDDSTKTWSTSYKWDSRRLVSKFVDLKETLNNAAQDITAKAVRFEFKTTAVDTPFRLVGWQVVADDYGERAEGTAKRD